MNQTITRKLIEDEYDLVGYTVLQLNNPDGTIRYGTYILDLYDGPIYIEELDALKRNEKQIKITVAKPGEYVPFNAGPQWNPNPTKTPSKTPKTGQSVAGADSKVGTPLSMSTP